MSRGPIVTGIGNAATVRELLVLDRDALARWRCSCGALASGPTCAGGHVAPWAVESVAEAKRRRATRLRAWRIRRGITMSPDEHDAWRERQRLQRLATERKQRERNRLSGTNGYRSREDYLAYQARYNEARAEQKRAVERERYWRRKAVQS